MSVSDEGAVTVHEGIPQIPVDLFIRKKKKKRKGMKLRHDGCDLQFTDTFGNLVYKVDWFPFSAGGGRKRVLLDSSDNHLLSVIRYENGSWKGFKGDGCEEKDVLFRAERILNTFGKIEFDVFLTGQDEENSSFKMKGCLFWKSCMIYEDKSTIAQQTSLMYTLGCRKIFVSRSKFRVTIFPGFADHTFIAGLMLIFLDGRKE